MSRGPLKGPIIFQPFNSRPSFHLEIFMYITVHTYWLVQNVPRGTLRRFCDVRGGGGHLHLASAKSMRDDFAQDRLRKLKPSPASSSARSGLSRRRAQDFSLGALRLRPEGAIQCPVVNGFGDVLGLDRCRRFQVGNGASDLEYAVVGAGGQTLLGHGALQQALAVG